MRQTTLFEGLRAYPGGPPEVAGVDTSAAAAESIRARVGSLRFEVWKYLGRCERRGATCDEVEGALGLRHQTCSARIRELHKEGFLEIVGRRKTSSGREARVYRVNNRRSK